MNNLFIFTLSYPIEWLIWVLDNQVKYDQFIVIVSYICDDDSNNQLMTKIYKSIMLKLDIC